MTSETIIQQFELQVSDITELSEAEEYIVLNRGYNKLCNSRAWEFLKKSTAGTILQDSGGYYITIPDDFAYFTSNNQYTDNTISPQNNAAPKVIFIGSNYTPYQIVNWSDRRQYRNQSGYAYLDLSSGKIRFTQTPTDTARNCFGVTIYEFDYISVPSALVAGSVPAFPSRFHDILVFSMATDDAIIQLSPKATSYAPENQVKYQAVYDDMCYWNAQLQLN